jgi:MFS family permease
VAVLAATPRALPGRGERGAGGGIDVAGALTLTAGMVSAVYALTSAPQRGWAAAGTWGMGLASVAALMAFVIAERRQRAPLVPLPIVARPRVLLPNAAVILQSMVGIAWLYLLTLYFQVVHGLGPLESGALFAPMTAASVGGAAVAGRALSDLGGRRLALVGSCLVAVGLGLMAACVPLDAGVPLIVVGMVVGEAGFMFASVALTAAATTSLDDAHAGLAAGLFNTSTQLGGGLGLAVVATVVATVAGGGVDVQAVQWGFVACLGFCGLAAVLIAIRPDPARTSIAERESFTP